MIKKIFYFLLIPIIWILTFISVSIFFTKSLLPIMYASSFCIFYIIYFYYPNISSKYLSEKITIKDKDFNILVILIFLCHYFLFTRLSSIAVYFIYSDVFKFEKIINILRGNLLNTFIYVVIIAPIFEEYFFRGVIYINLRRKLGVFFSIVITTILFALMHANLPQIIHVIPNSIILCLLFEYLHDINYPIAYHIFYNFIGFIFGYLFNMNLIDDLYKLSPFMYIFSLFIFLMFLYKQFYHSLIFFNNEDTYAKKTTQGS